MKWILILILGFPLTGFSQINLDSLILEMPTSANISQAMEILLFHPHLSSINCELQKDICIKLSEDPVLDTFYLPYSGLEYPDKYYTYLDTVPLSQGEIDSVFKIITDSIKVFSRETLNDVSSFYFRCKDIQDCFQLRFTPILNDFFAVEVKRYDNQCFETKRGSLSAYVVFFYLIDNNISGGLEIPISCNKSN